jgi:hypothetical protein
LCALSRKNTGAEDTRNKYALGGMLDNFDKEICQIDPAAALMSREDRERTYENGFDSSGLNRETIQFALTNNLNEEFAVTVVEEPSQASQPFANTVAIIEGTGTHWLAFVKVDGFWFNADSMHINKARGMFVHLAPQLGRKQDSSHFGKRNVIIFPHKCKRNLSSFKYTNNRRVYETL